jgi:hypothetical protein
MMMLRCLKFVCALALAALGATPLRAQTATAIVGDELRSLVSGRSWALSTYGDPTNPATTMIWDFRKDGTVCARPGASKVGDKCADEGRWVLRGNLVCWDLTWFGASAGFKSACSSVKRTGPQRLQLHNEKSPDLTFMVVKPL